MQEAQLLELDIVPGIQALGLLLAIVVLAIVVLAIMVLAIRPYGLGFFSGDSMGAF